MHLQDLLAAPTSGFGTTTLAVEARPGSQQRLGSKCTSGGLQWRSMMNRSLSAHNRLHLASSSV